MQKKNRIDRQIRRAFEAWPSLSVGMVFFGRFAVISAVVSAGALLGISKPLFAVETDKTKISSPEVEISKALTDLENSMKKLKVGDQVTHREGFGPQKVFEQKALMDGIKYFHKKEYLSAIRELTNYRNLSQVPVKEQYLAAVHKIARSHEALGNHRKAIRSYLHYLSSFLTHDNQNFDQMIDVVRRLLTLATKFDTNKHKDVGRLLASIASLELPAKITPELLYLTAKTAIKSGQLELASSWLDQASKSENTEKLRSRALYFKALIEVAAKRWDSAAELLTESIAVHKTDDDSSRELARLALARIAVHKAKPMTALKYYEAIPEDSGSFKDALFESVYLHLNVGENKKARAKATLFLSRFPNVQETYQLKTLLAYLSLRAGNVSSASQEVESASKSLGQLSGWLKTKYSGRKELNRKDVNDLVDQTDLKIVQSPIVKLSQENFIALAGLGRQLSEIKGEIRNLLFTIGRTTALDFRPKWINRSEQLARISEEVLTIGHHLIAAERYLYRKDLKGSQMQKLLSSENRRVGLLSAQANMKREKKRWVSLGNLLGLTQDLAQKYERVQVATANLATSRYLDSTLKSGKKRPEIDRMQARVDRMRDSLARALEVVRMQRVHEILVQSPHRSHAKFLSQYAMAIDEEALELKPIRESRSKAPERLLAQDASKAWKRWRFLTREIYRQFDQLEGEIKLGLKSVLEAIDLAEDKHKSLEAEVIGITQTLETRLGESIGLILGHYSLSISSRLSKQKKWSADLEWMKYQKSQKTSIDSKERFDLEKQILDDNLQSLYQGVLWKWPK